MSRLPEPFADLERFAERWCLLTEGERCARRLERTMDGLQELSDACFPRLEAWRPHVPDAGAARLDRIVEPVP